MRRSALARSGGSWYTEPVLIEIIQKYGVKK